LTPLEFRTASAHLKHMSETNGSAEATDQTGKEEGDVKYSRGQNPKSKMALTNYQFPKGKSGNPNGRPPGQPDRSTIITKWAATMIYVIDPTQKPKKKEYDEGGQVIEHEIKYKRISLLDAAALGLFKAASKGNVMAFQEIQDTLHGKIPNKVEAKHEHSFAALAKSAAEILGEDYVDGELVEENSNGEEHVSGLEDGPDDESGGSDGEQEHLNGDHAGTDSPAEEA
jgi:hypothetical protein